MESLALLDSFSAQALLLGLASVRIAIAFMLMPLFTSELIPAMVRNAMCMSFGVLALSLQPPVSPQVVLHANWILLFAKEAFLGAAIGFMFGTVLWAFEAAGQMIDSKVGTTTGQLSDPLTGQQTTFTGAFLGRLANFVFMFSGGLLLLTGTLIDSYVLWPMLSWKPVMAAAGITLFESEFGRLMLIALMLAAPVLVVMFTVDGILGLINRYSPQLNLFSLAASMKTWISTAMLILLVTSMVQMLIADIQTRPAIVLRTLRALFGS